MSKLKILLFPLDGAGHVHSFVGITNKLVELGHECIIALNKNCVKLVEKYGFPIEVYQDQNTKDEDILQKWGDFLKGLLPALPKPPLEQNLHMIHNASNLMSKFTMDNNDTFADLIKKVNPDCIIVDIFYCVPAFVKSDVPWILLWSCNPVAAYDEHGGPPAFSGLSPKDDPEKFKVFRDQNKTLMSTILKPFNDWLESHGVEPQTEQFYRISPYLNVYPYPEEIDYDEICPVPEKWVRVDHMVRPGDKLPLGVDEAIFESNEKVIFFSLGSIGCSDVELMKKIVSWLSKIRHKCIVTMGPHADQITLGANMVGAKFLNQMELLPRVDLVITHGGNNTFLETLYHGKPLIILPIFGDQHDNATRVRERNLGKSFNPYHMEEKEFLDGIEEVLEDHELQERIKKLGEKMRNSKSFEEFNRRLVEVVLKHKKSVIANSNGSCCVRNST